MEPVLQIPGSDIVYVSFGRNGNCWSLEALINVVSI